MRKGKDGAKTKHPLRASSLSPGRGGKGKDVPGHKGRRPTMCYWRKICEKIKYLEIEKRYGHAVSGILKAIHL